MSMSNGQKLCNRLHKDTREAGIPDRMFKRHGRWQSENAKDGYVKDLLEARLDVSKSSKL